jgi:hypothetical protein
MVLLKVVMAAEVQDSGSTTNGNLTLGRSIDVPAYILDMLRQSTPGQDAAAKEQLTQWRTVRVLSISQIALRQTLAARLGGEDPYQYSATKLAQDLVPYFGINTDDALAMRRFVRYVRDVRNTFPYPYQPQVHVRK